MNTQDVDYLKAQTDKLILFLWIGLLGVSLVHFTHHGEKDAYEWAVRAYDNIQGALLMLLTGRAIQRRETPEAPDNGTLTQVKTEVTETRTAGDGKQIP